MDLWFSIEKSLHSPCHHQDAQASQVLQISLFLNYRFFGFPQLLWNVVGNDAKGIIIVATQIIILSRRRQKFFVYSTQKIDKIETKTTEKSRSIGGN